MDLLSLRIMENQQLAITHLGRKIAIYSENILNIFPNEIMSRDHLLLHNSNS